MIACESEDSQSKPVSGLDGADGVSQEEDLRSELHVKRNERRRFGILNMQRVNHAYLMTCRLC